MNTNTADRNVLTLTISALTLTALILGISFTLEKKTTPSLHSMDIIISTSKSMDTPDEADYLSQNNQQGGGSSTKKVRPQDINSTPVEMYDGQHQKHSNKSQKKQVKQNTKILTNQSSTRRTKKDHTSESKPNQAKENKDSSNKQMAKLKQEIAKKIEQYAKRPKTKYLSSSSKAYDLAPYIDYWVKKIERTGDLNYPEQAKRKNFRGNVMLTVGIWKTGEIESIKISRSSGYKFLDEAAVHIVNLAQPFDALPEHKENLDIIYITRTWQFLPGHLLRQK